MVAVEQRQKEAAVRQPIRVLVVDDSADDADLVLLELSRGGFDVTSERVETAEAMTRALQRLHWDVVLADHSMPQFSSAGALAVLNDASLDIPCIIVSGAIGEETAVAAMRNGATDYILKDNLARLGPAVERELREAEVRRKHRQAEQAVAYVTSHDPLTSLPNRNLLDDRFQQAIARTRRSQSAMAVMFLDVDRFKNINETLGHTTGDQLLQTVAHRLRETVREDDTVARWGGDEFVLLFPEISGAAEATRLAQEVLDAFKALIRIEEQELFVTVSIGIALYPDDGDDMSDLMRNAATAMSRVKEQTRNHYRVYSRQMNARSLERLSLETSLRHAVERNELRVHYQPQLDIGAEAVVGLEALVRWQHPELGFLYPSRFIGLAEESGLIVPVGLWVLRTACEQARQWQKDGLPPLRIAVNLSARQFLSRDLVETVAATLASTGLDPRLLELEITESLAMQYGGFTMTMLRELKAMGIQIAIDDFGTGYSSLSLLNRFPFDKLKIDQSFVRRVNVHPHDAAIARTIITLGRSLNRTVIAEGVETREQLSFLREEGCDEVQGYLFSRPAPPREVAKFVRAHPPRH